MDVKIHECIGTFNQVGVILPDSIIPDKVQKI